jgi:RNA polymerase sigma-70 factor, ECF subfamily
MQSSEPDLAELHAKCVRSGGVDSACEQFFALFRPVLRRIAYRVSSQFCAREEADDLVQEMSLKFASEGAIVLASVPKESAASLAYFSVVAANAARDYFRSRNAVKRGFDRTISLDESLAMIMGGTEAGLDRDLLISQIESCMPQDRKSCTVFRLYFRQGFSAKEISAIPALDLSTKGVESLIHRTILHIRERLGLSEPSSSSAQGRCRLNPL